MDPAPPRVPMEIRTERIWLRSGRPGDEQALLEAIDSSLPELFPWTSFSAKPSDLATLEEVCRRSAEKFAAAEFFVWRLWEPDGRTMIGTVSLHSIDRAVPSAELGFWMRTSHTGKGLAREAVEAVLEVAWRDLDALRIEARCDTRNERSWRLVERLGFELEGIARNDDRDAAGELCSTRVYARLREA